MLIRPHYHVGVAVADIEAAMAEIGAALHLSWARVQDLVLAGHPIRLTYSLEGPPHVELVEGPAGSIWQTDGRDIQHHVGYWTDDLKGDRARLEADGYRAVFETPGATYHEGPGGFRVELVDVRIRAALMRWFAGGDFR